MIQSGPVLGIEGTAWNLSASVFDDELRTLYSHPYQPETGGIHPREAAQHHAAQMSHVISEAVRDHTDGISAVAFSIGPGLGPCLRIVATAARSLAQRLQVPLIGVNHCVAHIEIGRYATGFTDPIVLYASGANTQVLGYLQRRYRIFGETLDIGLGNALDKFARSRDLPHPGGPFIEEYARGGSYIPLPYTVKGMDLAFSGLLSAAKDAQASLKDVCFSLQETAFAMCVEVTERALAQTGKEEMILVGGVGANRRLQEMLAQMCTDREARFGVPPSQYLGDNGAMIAYTGRLMLEQGDVLPIPKSQVNPSFRADQVPVSWRDSGDMERYLTGAVINQQGERQGAEARIQIGSCTQKKRLQKSYRDKTLDLRLITERTRAEARLIAGARRAGVPTPIILDITKDTITMETIDGILLKEVLTPENLDIAGVMVGKLHNAGIVHGDLTTCNMIMRNSQCVLIDFGLAGTSSDIEARGVDLHVLFQILTSTAEDAESLKSAFCTGYQSVCTDAHLIFAREHEIELRGRYL